MEYDVHIIGGGLAGCEAAWQLAQRGKKVRLSEMRGGGAALSGDAPAGGASEGGASEGGASEGGASEGGASEGGASEGGASEGGDDSYMTPAHQGTGLAELVCSNSFRSDDDTKSAVGLLHHEMRRMDSLIMAAGELARVPAGSAMAVDRDLFSAEVEKRLNAHPNITIIRERIDNLPQDIPTIVATGPLTAASLAQGIVRATGEDRLAFFDAIAPIVHRDSINMDICWFQSRWDKPSAGMAVEQVGGGCDGKSGEGSENRGGGEAEKTDGADPASPAIGKDYINCPMTREQYLAFHQGLMDGEKTSFKLWEEDTPYFEGCMPIEVMAARGVDTLRFGPMKPVGLDDPRTACEEFPQGRWPYAVVQLRQDNRLGTLWNMVGFQTKLKHGAQVELFRTIPGLEGAEFARLGGLHRNTFLNSPTVLDNQLRLKSSPNIRFAGQITGCEGYVESSAIGLIAGLLCAVELSGKEWTSPPASSAIGALLGHITQGADAQNYQPMNINFGLFPPMHKVKKKLRKEAYTNRAKEELGQWLQNMEMG